ncbi:MAG: hypothetical protein ABL907_06565 [Hyphomicrobium sp.]
MHAIKNLMDGTPLYHTLRAWRSWLRANGRRAAWEKQGRPVPPPDVVKQDIVKDYAKRYGAKTLVETGTYVGDMVQATKGAFERIYSIELSHDLAERARRRFASDRNVTILQGDSGALLAELLPKLAEPALFWLDAHYSAGITAKGDLDTPIVQELTHILQPTGPRHVILIDDARCFGVDDDYPTIETISNFVRDRAPGYSTSVEHDSIRIVPTQ